MKGKRPSALCGRLGKLNPADTVIVGIGNTLKGDDGAGPKVCGILKGKIAAEVMDAGSTPENYITKIVRLSPKKLLVIDAIDFGAVPGTVQIFDTKDLGKFSLSTHCLSPHLFVQLILSQINTEVIFIGIQPANVQLGSGLSKEVDRAIAAFVERIILVFSRF